MDLKWLQDDENIPGTNECDHFNASFISENQNIKIDETIKNPYSALEFSDNLDKMFQAIKESDLNKVKMLVNSHKIRCNNLGGGPEFKWDIVNDLSKNWSPFHFSIYQGVDKIFLWFLSQGGDINQLTYDGYSCLNLAVLSGNELMVNLLIGQKGININHVSRKGSALHMAVQQNNISILQILLQHPNINLNILNDIQKQPIDLAKGKIKEILVQELVQRAAIQYSQLLSSFISSVKDKKFTFLINRPKKPPIFKGFVQKLHISKLYSYQRYLIVDPDSGVLARFQDEQNAPLNPKEIIPLQSIFNLQIVYEHWLLKKNYLYLLIEYNSNKLYFMFDTEKQAKRWYECIRLAAGYTRYIKYKLEQYTFTQEQSKIFNNVILMLMENANEEIIIDNSISQKALEVPEETNCPNTQLQEAKVLLKINFSQFKVIDIVGKGSYGYILKVEMKNTNKTFALKQQIKEQLLKSSSISYAINELKLLRKLNHPFLIKVIGAFQTPKCLYYLMNYYEKGDLSLYIGKGQILSENIAKILIAQIILAIEYLHQYNIIYRDLKPLNILVGDDGFLKLSDLGLATQMENDRQALSFCGSPAYLSPETIQGNGVSKSADIYGIGLILYEMLTGYPPHFTYNIDHLLERILYNPIEFDKIQSQTAIKLLKRILDKNQQKRLTIEEIKQHLFFADIDWNKILEKSIIPPILNRVNLKQDFLNQAGQYEMNDVDYNEDEFKEHYIQDWEIN